MTQRDRRQLSQTALAETPLDMSQPRKTADDLLREWMQENDDAKRAVLRRQYFDARAIELRRPAKRRAAPKRTTGETP